MTTKKRNLGDILKEQIAETKQIQRAKAQKQHRKHMNRVAFANHMCVSDTNMLNQTISDIRAQLIDIMEARENNPNCNYIEITRTAEQNIVSIINNF